MKKTKLALSLITSTLLISQASAYQVAGTIEAPMPVTSHGMQRTPQSQTDVTILRIKLSEKEKEAIARRTPRVGLQTMRTASKLPSAIQLGMNNVPVLNQGRHGSCVTFAISAAIDALLGKGDYISQLCSLELGTHLEKNGYMPSGWDGSYGTLVLEQMMRFGVVSKSKQLTQSCANMYEYPVLDKTNTGNEMALSEFRTASENINQTLYWTHLFSNDQVFDWKTDAPEKMQEVLNNVKKALVNGNRVTFGTFLILNPKCRGGACATYQASHDTWALTAGLETPPYEVGGHEMVITGYDDNAAAYDVAGGKHVGLLTLRNSWGEAVGDNGNFYMSYDYFIKYANEVQEVIAIK